jgi:hypothetical protein
MGHSVEELALRLHILFHPQLLTAEQVVQDLVRPQQQA